jgi:hypothetical protein
MIIGVDNNNKNQSNRTNSKLEKFGVQEETAMRPEDEGVIAKIILPRW